MELGVCVEDVVSNLAWQQVVWRRQIEDSLCTRAEGSIESKLKTCKQI